jgi:hypothetical protein
MKFHLVAAAANTSALRRPSRHLDRGRPVDAGGHHGAIGVGDALERARVLARHHLDDALEPMRAVAGIDPLGRVAELEVDACFEPRGRRERGPTDLARQARIDRRLEDHHRARLERRADQAAGALERAQVGAALLVDGRRHRHDEEAGVREVGGIVGQAQRALPERVRCHLAGAIDAALELGDPLLGDVEADHRREMPREGERHRQADIAQSQHRETALAHAFGPSRARRSR